MSGTGFSLTCCVTWCELVGFPLYASISKLDWGGAVQGRWVVHQVFDFSFHGCFGGGPEGRSRL